MKIGIITIHRSPSYGGSLQAFALYTYLNDKGYDTEMIDLLRATHKGYKYSYRFHPMRAGCLGRMKTAVKAIAGKESQYPSRKQYNQLFKEFNNELRYSRTYHNADELYDNPPVYDVCITGSDQVWNPAQDYVIEPYFLTFVKSPTTRKIAYAASVGLAKLYPKEEKRFKKWIEYYDSVAVRETTLKNYLSNFVDKKIERVADPTFLLDREKWKSVAILPEKKEHYILLFELSHQKELVDFCLRMSKQSGMKLVVLGQGEPLSKDGLYEVVNTAGPREFLGFISAADMVITDSFHATVFSIIMEAKNFFTYISPSNERGSRITDLLKTHKALDHLLVPDLKQRWEELLKIPVRKDEINHCYLEEQILSRSFLDNSLRENEV